ncbi:MAG: glucose-6-phosphate dehydrogenase [Acidobacteriota bacterium]
MQKPSEPVTLVIFGAGGDLTRRLLVPALHNLLRKDLLPDHFRIIGFARTDLTTDGLRDVLRDALQEAEDGAIDSGRLDRLLGAVMYIRAAFDDPAGWEALRRAADGHVLFYLATAPEHFQGICERLGAAGLLAESAGAWRRVIVEKPFGRDLDSARALNRGLAAVMREGQIFRIDHYLGKETVQNIVVFRFGNGIFEPVWNRRYVDHVQITVAETLGVEGRGGYYDRTGALRDMVPNHLFQLLTFTAMEPPVVVDADALHREQAKLLSAVVPLGRQECGADTVRAQYAGYRAEPRVDARSSTETFAAFRMQIDNWRWAGVPFYVRTGKRLAAKRTEVVIQFRQPPLMLFRHASAGAPPPNQLVLSIQPQERIALELAAKVPGPTVTTSGVQMTFDYRDYFGVDRQTGYETLLYDAMMGDRSLFKPADVIEAGWALVDPILKAWEGGSCSLGTYVAGSDGPSEAAALLARDGRAWRPLAP